MTILFHFFIVAYNGSEEINTFGCVNRHTVRMWGSQHPHQTFKRKDIPQKSLFVVVCPTNNLLDQFSSLNEMGMFTWI